MATRTATSSMPGMRAEPSDESLVQAIRAGDRSAEFELDRRWRHRLVELVRPILRDEDLAQDAAQLALWRAYLNLDRYDHTRPFEPWLIEIARHCAFDLLRRRPPQTVNDGQRILPTVPGPSQHGAEQVARREELDALQACMNGLGERSRLVVALFMMGLSLSEMGLALQSPKSTVQGWLQEALQHLRQCLEDKGFKDDS